MKKNTISFRDPIYFINYTVVVGNWNDFYKLVKKIIPDFSDKPSDGKLLAVSSENDGRSNEFYIYLARLDIPLLAHEVVHAAIKVFDKIGSPINMSTDECFAYYVQWLVGTIYYNFKKSRIDL